MGEPTKKNPQSEGILADDSELGGGGIAALPDRVSRYGEAHRRALAMADYAIEHGDRPIAGKLKKCGDYLLFRHFFTAIKSSWRLRLLPQTPALSAMRHQARRKGHASLYAAL